MVARPADMGQPHNTLYMFTSEGGRKHSMTIRVLRHLLGMDLVKVVSQQGVLDGALDGVARTAMQNSVQGKGRFVKTVLQALVR